MTVRVIPSPYFSCCSALSQLAMFVCILIVSIALFGRDYTKVDLTGLDFSIIEGKEDQSNSFNAFLQSMSTWTLHAPSEPVLAEGFGGHRFAAIDLNNERRSSRFERLSILQK